MTLWQLFTLPLACGAAVCVRDEGFDHQGILARVKLLTDGSCELRFSDGVEVAIPALKSIPLPPKESE